MATSVFAPSFSEEQLGDLLALLSDAGSVELKLTVPESDHYSVTRALGIDSLDAQIRQVYFFDTPDLSLNAHGVVVRARRVQGRSGDSVVKVRPVVPTALPKRFRQAPTMTVELDAMPGGFVCSATMKRSAGNADVAEVVAGALPLGTLFSKRQLAFLDAHRPDGVGLEDLFVLGPVQVLKLKFEPGGLERRLVAELWMYPDHSGVLELSTKCEPEDAFRAAAEMRVFLAGQGVDLTGAQETKTRKALEFFSSRMQSAGP
jgi:hypothetical protein